MDARKVGMLALLAIASVGCKSVGHKFCTSNGHPKGSTQYEQCTLHYEANQDLYEYCQNVQGLVQEGAQINQCIATARGLKNVYGKDIAACQRDADAKFAVIFSQPKKEKQPTLHPDGMVSMKDIALNAGYSPDERATYTDPFIDECLQAYGWNNGSWQGGKTQVSMQSTLSRLSKLNQQPIAVNVPINPIGELFKAVSDGNAYAVKDIIIKQNMPVNAQNYQGYAALHVAAKQGNFQIVQMLIEELDADTSLRSARGEDAIAMAAQGPNPNLVSYITDILRKRDAERIRREEEARHRKEMEEMKRLIQQQQSPQAPAQSKVIKK